MKPLAAALAALALTVTVVAPAEAVAPAMHQSALAVQRGDKPMSVDRAGRVYLKAVCKSNAALKRFDRRLWHGRARVPVREVRRKLPKFKREATKFGKAEQRFARALFNPPAPWPDSVASLADRLGDKTATYSQYRLDQGKAHTAGRWIRLNEKANRVKFGTYAARIRARLDLPPPGEGC